MQTQNPSLRQRAGRAWRWAALALGLLVLLVIANSRLSAAPTTAHVAGLSAPVAIWRDRWDVPHIWAADEHDLFVAQGYLAAQDRLWQMLLRRQAARGRLSEWLGDSAAEADALLAAQKFYAGDQDELPALEAYAAGVNAYLASGARPIELILLQARGVSVEPEAWTAQDSLAIARMMDWAQTLAAPDAQLDNDLIGRVGAERAADLSRARICPALPASAIARQILHLAAIPLPGDRCPNMNVRAMNTSPLKRAAPAVEGGLPPLRFQPDALASGQRRPTDALPAVEGGLPPLGFQPDALASGASCPTDALPAVEGGLPPLRFQPDALASGQRRPKVNLRAESASPLKRAAPAVEGGSPPLRFQPDALASGAGYSTPTLPPAWHIVTLHSPAYQAGGAALAGLPGVVSGRSTDRAWSAVWSPQTLAAGRADGPCAVCVALQDVRQPDVNDSSAQARHLLPYLIALEPHGWLQKRVTSMLAKWDYRLEAQSASAAVYETWVAALGRRTFADELGPELYARFAASGGATATLVQLAGQPDNLWWDDVTTPQRETRDDMMRLAYADALDYLGRHYGDLHTIWEWGQMHAATFKHALGDRWPESNLLNRGPIFLGGDGFSQPPAPFDPSASFEPVLIPALLWQIDSDGNLSFALAGEQAALVQLPGRGQLEAWRTGHYTPLLWDKAEIQANAHSALTLLP